MPSDSDDRALYAVIMAGGSGTRFWPASRRARPKQFLSVAADVPMLTATRDRLSSIVPDEHVLVVAGEAHAELVRETLPTLPAENLLLEPVGRNTLPCIAWANAEVRRRDPNALQAVFPADHVIEPVDEFLKALRVARRTAATGDALVTLGIAPRYAATAYGYIEAGAELDRYEGLAVHDVARFVEKPGEKRAQEYLELGGFYWNSGIFVWSTSAITNALTTHAPALWKTLANARPDEVHAAYPTLEPISVDVGLMEVAATRRVVPVDFQWSDVGSWSALSEVLPADANGNFLAGKGALEALEASGNIVHASNDTLVALIGVQDLVVVHAGGTVLVCSRERAEDVRALVDRLGDRHTARK